MRPHRTLLQRCLGSTFHASAALLAASAATPRRSSKFTSSTTSNNSSSAGGALHVLEIDGEEFRPTEYARGGSQRRRAPTQLLADLNPQQQHQDQHPKKSGSTAAASGAVAVNPVELLLQKHDVRNGGGSHGGDGGNGGSSSSSGNGGKDSSSGGRGKLKRVPLTPPTKAETATRTRSAGDKRSTKESRSTEKEECDLETEGVGPVTPAATKSSSSSTATDNAANSDDYQKSLQILTNPFRGLHSNVARSYRIDQLLEGAKPEDIMLARQERKSAAFSFLRFKAGEEFYEGHWASLPEMQQYLESTLSAHTPIRGSSGNTTATPYVRGTPIPGLTLFNNDLGLQNPLVQCSYPLILAQRMLLFPDHLRQFHTICGREDVPCDFFADIDLQGESQAGAEKVLLEVLNYLEVRLPGVGFTDPFFLVLTNAVPAKDKISYHIHARSMTHVRERQLRAQQQGADAVDVADGNGSKRKAGKKSKKGTKDSASNTVEEDEEAESEVDDYDDLSDMVNVVDNTGTTGKKKLAGSTKLIAFQDYRTVKLIGDEVNQTLGRDVIDTNCYRPNGMLRCAFSSKLPSTQDHDFYAQQQQDRHGAAARKRLVPLVTASDATLQKRLSEMEGVLRTMTDPEILELTFCTRHLDHDAKVQRLVHEHAKSLTTLDSHSPAGSEAQRRNAAVLQATLKHRWKLIRPRHILGPQAAQAVEYDIYGNVVSPFLTEGAKWRRYKAVTAKLRKLPPRAAESYDVWVRVGLALHNFSNEDNCFEEWVLFSLKSPQKYSREVCRKKWLQFERNPDALNWRRGYNYLNSTVWRQV